MPHFIHHQAVAHPVLKETAHEIGAGVVKFGLHHVAALIERAGGCPGVWADIPKEIERGVTLELLQFKGAYASMKATAECSEHGPEFIKSVVSSILGGQTVESVIHVADDSRLVKDQLSLGPTSRPRGCSHACPTSNPSETLDESWTAWLLA